MQSIIHKTIEKSKYLKYLFYKNRGIILKYCVFCITGVLCFIAGISYEKINSLRDSIEIIYPELYKNTVVYLPESERNILLNNYNNMSNILDETTTQEGIAAYGQNFVASKNGSRYYPVDCKSSSRIKPENKIYFNTANDAERAGLTLASGCSL